MESPPPPSTRATSGTRPRTRPQLLVVEDDPVLRESLVALMVDEGYDTIAVSGLAAAREVLAENTTAVMILDLTLEGEFGADLLAELVGVENAPATIIVSAFQLATLVAERYGVEVIRKPFAIEEVAKRVREALAHRNQPRTRVKEA